MTQVLAVFLGVALLTSVCRAEEQTTLKDEKARDSYSLGYAFGENLKTQGVEVDRDVLLSAVRDALENKTPVLSQDEMHIVLKELRQKTVILRNRRYKELADKNLKEGETFLCANKVKEGVTTLPSGLQYKVLTEGNGPSPKVSDMVTVNYRGTLVDGTEFDGSSRYGGSATLRVNGVIPGWTEALPHMKVGSKWEIFVPSQLAYGERGLGRIPPQSTLIFEIELVSIGPPASKPASSDTAKPQTTAAPSPKEGKHPTSRNKK